MAISGHSIKRPERDGHGLAHDQVFGTNRPVTDRRTIHGLSDHFQVR